MSRRGVISNQEKFDQRNLLCWYDCSLGDNQSETRTILNDLSGNGRDLTLRNFSFNEQGSGYKDGALWFDGIDDYLFRSLMFPDGLSEITIFMKRKLLNTTKNFWVMDYRGVPGQPDPTYSSDLLFIFEYFYRNDRFGFTHWLDKTPAYSYIIPEGEDYPDGISWATKTLYNGHDITNIHSTTSKELYSRDFTIGCICQTTKQFFCKMGLYEFMVFAERVSESKRNNILNYLNRK